MTRARYVSNPQAIDIPLTVSANLTANAVITVGNSSVNSVITSNTYSVGSNVSLSTSRLFLGNSTVNSVHTASTLDVGANVNLSTVGLNVGSNTVNAYINSTSFAIGNSTVNTAITSTTITSTALLSIGNTNVTGTANVSTAINVGANVNLSTSQINVGNSTVNTVISATALTTTSNTVSIGTAAYVVANGNVGIGTSSPAYKLDVNSDIKVANAIRYFVGATQYGVTFANAGAVGTEAYQNTYIFWGTGSGASATERMRLDASGNLGIGTSSPPVTLSVVGTIGVFGGSLNGSLGSPQLYRPASDTLAIATGAVERMRIDSSGNLGIGTSSPSMTASNRVVIDVNGTTSSLIAQSSGGTTRGYGYVDSTQMIYGSKTAIPLIFQTTETERMRLDTSGNLLATGGFIPTNTSRLVVRGYSAISYNNTFSTANATVQIISDEMSVNQWYPTVNITMVRQSLTTGANAFGGIGFSTIDDSNNSGMYDAGRIAIVNDTGSAVASGTSMAFYTQVGSANTVNAATERMRIDSSGNMGLGVTPTALWNSSIKAVQLSGGSFYTYAGLNIGLAQNCYFSNSTGTWIFSSAAAASIYYQNAGAHYWNRSTATPVAGTDPTLTAAMTLDASGNLGVGIDTPLAGYRGHFVDTRAADSVAVGVRNLSASGITRFVLGNNIGYARFTIGYNGSTYASNPSTAWLGTEGSEALWFKTNDTARLWITSAGYIGVNTSSPETNGAFCIRRAVTTSAMTNCSFSTSDASNSTFDIGHPAANVVALSAQGSNLTFWGGGALGNAERMRIDQASGSLLVGVTSGSYHTLAKDIAGNWSTEIRNSNANPYGLYIRHSGAAPNNSVNEFLYCGDTVGQKMAIRSNGGIANFSGSNVSLSDRREKTNFAPAKSYLNVICAIPVQTFNYIDQDMKDDGGLTLGVVAQDVQAVAPELVMESNWANKNEEPKMRLSIYQTDLQFALMKCIQEQQALIAQLQADVAELKLNK